MMRATGTSGDPDDGHPNSVVAQPLRSGTPKAAQLIVADLRRQIIRGDLQGDDSLPSENELMRLYGVSRPTLREALRVLEFEGSTHSATRSQGGSTVHVPNGEAAARSMGLVLEHRGATLADVLEARSHHRTCLRQIGRRARQEGASAPLEAEPRSQCPGGSDSTQSNGFHDLLVDLAGNQTLTLMYGMLRVVLNESTTGVQLVECTDTRNLDGRRRAHDAHQHLVDLIERKDGDQAEEFWTEHLRSSYLAR